MASGFIEKQIMLIVDLELSIHFFIFDSMNIRNWSVPFLKLDAQLFGKVYFLGLY